MFLLVSHQYTNIEEEDDISNGSIITMYVDEMNAKAAVKFLVTRNSLAKLLKRFSVSAAVGGGSMASHGGGVTTDCLAAMTFVGGSGMAEAGSAKAVRAERRRETARILCSWLLLVRFLGRINE